MTTADQRLPSTPLHRILAAASFAARAHANHKRKGAAGEPYINHLIEVAELVSQSSTEIDANLIMACFLHDVVEDTVFTAADLAREFDQDVVSLVMEVTDDTTQTAEVRKAKQVETAPFKSPCAQTLKLADKISNLRSLLLSPPPGWSVERKRRYFDWANAVVSAFTSPNPALLLEFKNLYQRIEEIT